jgi:hypothetical protein
LSGGGDQDGDWARVGRAVRRSVAREIVKAMGFMESSRVVCFERRYEALR